MKSLLVFIFIFMLTAPLTVLAENCSNKINSIETIGDVKSVLRCLESESSKLDGKLTQQSSHLADVNGKIKNNESDISALKNKPVITNKLECEINRVSSNFEQYPAVTAVIPPNRIAEGYVRVGGGCEIEKGGKPTIPHNATMLKSIPSSNGWACSAGDPPGIPLPTRVEAYVVFCKLK